jgi:hypothetical protein
MVMRYVARNLRHLSKQRSLYQLSLESWCRQMVTGNRAAAAAAAKQVSQQPMLMPKRQHAWQIV